MEPKELIKRYAHDVARRLPRSQQADVQAELISLLQETLEARAETSGRPIDDALAVDVLREFGEPGEVARRYGPQNQYLIGPAYYPTFILVIRIVVLAMIGVFGLTGVLTVLSSPNPQADLGSILWQSFGSLISALWSSLGVVVFIFAIIERVAAKSAPESPDWDPRALPEVEDPNQLSRGEQIVTIVFSTLALILFNLFPNWVDITAPYYSAWSGQSHVLAPTFFVHLPWFNVSWLLEIGLALLLLRAGRWNRLTRWLKFGTSIFSVVILYRMITGEALLTMPFLDALVKGSLMIALTVVIIEAVVKLFQLSLRGDLAGLSRFKPTSAKS